MVPKALQSLLLSGPVFGKLLWYLKHPLSLYYQSLQCLTVLDTMKTLITWKYNTRSDYTDYEFSFMEVASICPAWVCCAVLSETDKDHLCQELWWLCPLKFTSRKSVTQVWIHEFPPLMDTVPGDFSSAFFFLWRSTTVSPDIVPSVLSGTTSFY